MRIFLRQACFALTLFSITQYASAAPINGPQTPADQKLGEICAINGAIAPSSPLSGLISDICDEQASIASGYSCKCRTDPNKNCHSDSVKECAKNCSKAECKECCGTFTNEGNWAFLRCMDSCCGGMGKYDENYRCTSSTIIGADAIAQ